MEEKTMDELKQEIESLRLALIERNKKAQRKATIDFGKMMAELNEQAGEFIDAVQPQAKALLDAADKKIKQHPFVSICTALGAGLILASISKSNKNIDEH